MPTNPAPFAFAVAAGALASAFAVQLGAELTPLQWRTMRLRNRTAESGVCASHDFCDANMPMHDAFLATVGHAPSFIVEGASEAQSDADLALWGAAWGIAKGELLTSRNDWSTAGNAFDAWRCSRIDVVRLADYAELVGDIENDNGGRIYSIGFVEQLDSGEFYCCCGNADILTDNLFIAERFLWDNHAASETQYG